MTPKGHFKINWPLQFCHKLGLNTNIKTCYLVWTLVYCRIGNWDVLRWIQLPSMSFLPICCTKCQYLVLAVLSVFAFEWCICRRPIEFQIYCWSELAMVLKEKLSQKSSQIHIEWLEKKYYFIINTLVHLFKFYFKVHT